MSGQRLLLRVTHVNDEHVRCSLFMNGALCGQLCFRVGEYQIFGAALGLGAERTNGHLECDHDDEKFRTHFGEG